jgi:integrase
MKRPDTPNVRSRKNPSGERVYFVDYFDFEKNKRVREVVGPRKAEADRRAAEIYQQRKDEYLGVAVPTVNDITLGELIDAFFRSKEGRVAPSTIKRYRIHAAHLVAFVDKNFPKVKNIRAIRKIYIEELFDALRLQAMEPKTLNAQLQFVKAIFIFAEHEGYLAESPAKRIKPFRETKQSQAVPFWSKAEVSAILAEVKHGWRDAYEFLYHTGLRKGELANLTWDDVDLEHDPPSIAIQAKDDWTTKTLKRRIVPLNSRAAEIIKRQTRSKKHIYVFKAPEGGQIHPDKIYRELKRALTVLNLEGDVHQWRHTFASHLVMSGVDIATVSKLLGHHSIEMTMKYSHLAPDHLQAAVNQLVATIKDESETSTD